MVEAIGVVEYFSVSRLLSTAVRAFAIGFETQHHNDVLKEPLHLTTRYVHHTTSMNVVMRVIIDDRAAVVS